MTGSLLDELIEARRRRLPCFLLTVAATKGSVPRQAGSRMLLYPDGRTSGTIGGGKFESLALADARALPHRSPPLLKSYPLHETSPEAFGAICGGEVTVLIEPLLPPPSLVLVGAGHCARALAALATSCGWHVTAIDDRADALEEIASGALRHSGPAPEYIGRKTWSADEALVLVSRNYQLDRDALAAALRHPGMGYLGMIGSHRKVRKVVEELLASGFTRDDFKGLRAPTGLDLGADHPAEIAVSIFAEILMTMNQTSGRPLSLDLTKSACP